MKKLTLIFLIFAFPVAAATGDVYYIKSEETSLVYEPGMDDQLVKKVFQDRAVIEVDREGEWVKVVEQEGKGAGWVRLSELSTVPVNPIPADVQVAMFDSFSKQVRALNEDIREFAIRGLYRDIRNLGGGTVELVITDTWLRFNHEERKSNLKYMLYLWQRVQVNKNAKLKVRFVDSRGQEVMTMTKN